MKKRIISMLLAIVAVVSCLGTMGVSASNFTDLEPHSYYYAAVDHAEQLGIVKGTSKTTFSPHKQCTRAEIVTMLHRFAGTPKVTEAAGGKVVRAFKDINKDAYYYEAVKWAVYHGITNGTSPTSFSPNQVCTRAQIVTLLHRFVRYYEGDRATPCDIPRFVDCEQGSYYIDAVYWAECYQITSGTDATHFSPNDPCTRAHAVTFIFRAEHTLPESFFKTWAGAKNHN